MIIWASLKLELMLTKDTRLTVRRQATEQKILTVIVFDKRLLARIYLKNLSNEQEMIAHRKMSKRFE